MGKAVSCARPKDYKKAAAAEAMPTFEKGCLLRITGIGANARRSDISETMAIASNVKFVDYFPGDGKPTDTAIVRFKDGSCADEALKYFEANPTKIGGSESAATLAKLPEDEEAAYFKMLTEKTARSGGSRHGGRNKRQKRTKKHQDKGAQKRPREDAEAAPAKRAKTE